jgi:hypothetical protein
MRAVAQQTIRTLEDIGVMAQRVSSMLGGTAGGGAASTVPNQVPQLFGSATSSYNVSAAIAQANGASYGSAANATPQWNPSYATLPLDMTNPAFASIPTNFGTGPTAQPVPNQVAPSPADQAPASPSPADQQRDSDIAKIKHFTEAAMGGEFLENTGASQAGQLQSLASHPSVRGITQTLASKLGEINPRWGAKQIAFSGLGKDAGSGAAWATVPKGVQTRLANAAMSGDPAAIDALETAARVGVPAEAAGISGAIGSLAGGGSLVEAGGALLGGGVMAVAAPVAIGAAALGLGLHEMEAQRAQNAAIQSQIGGSNFSAFGTRASSFGYGLEHLSVMGMGMSNQAYMGVREMGLQGAAGQNALGFVQSNYANMGMSVADSLALVSTSVKAGNANLTQLAATLDAVTNSAAAASVNTEQARQNFSAMYQTQITSGMSTSAAATSAGAAQMITNSLGLSGQGAKFGQAPAAQAAAAIGMPLDQYMQQIAQNNTGAVDLWGRSQQAVENQRLTPFVSGIPNVQHLASLAAQHQSGGASLFAQAAMSGQYGTPVLPQMLPGILSAAGIDTSGMDPSGMWDAYAKVIANPQGLQHAVSNTQAQQTINQQIGKLRPHKAGGIEGFFGLGGSSGDLSTQNHQLSGAQSNIDTYITNHGASSSGAGIAAALLAHGSQDQVSGAAFGQGGTGSESIQAALGNSTTFQALMAGKGTINVNGKNMSIGQFVAQHKTSLVPPSSTQGNNNKKGSTGTVTIDLTPAAAQLVQVAASGAAQIGNTYGTTPPTGVDPYNNAFAGA